MLVGAAFTCSLVRLERTCALVLCTAFFRARAVASRSVSSRTVGARSLGRAPLFHLGCLSLQQPLAFVLDAMLCSGWKGSEQRRGVSALTSLTSLLFPSI